MWWLWLSACLLLAEQPPLPVCDEATCGRYKCDSYDPSVCGDICLNNSDCQDNSICFITDCVAPCHDGGCPDGFICNDILNECQDSCTTDDDCQRGWTCCTASWSGCEDWTCFQHS